MRRSRSSYTKKRTFRGNQHVSSQQNNQEPARQISASAGKITKSKRPKLDDNHKGNEESTVSGYRFVDMAILSSIFKNLPCKECLECCLILQEMNGKRKGCASCLRLLCCSCGWSIQFSTSKQISKFFEVNRRLVYSMRSIGCGHAAAKRFCGLMNMPPPPRPTPYSHHNKALLKAVKEVSLETMTDAATEIHTKDGESINDIVQCGISCDGTRQRRGFSSLNGCVTVISIDTGKVLDVEALSKVCKQCKDHEDDKDSPQNAAWIVDHEGKCKANFTGSAPAMEPQGAMRIFSRSIDDHKLMYNEYFGDGDSKSFQNVKDVYQDQGVTVEKKECVGHVQKRLGTALRKLKKEKKGLGGKGRLTDSMIDKMQNYYGIAISGNPGNLEGMKKAIHATLFHCASSEKRPLHNHCPKGADSWCGYMRDKANNTQTYKHGAGLPVDVAAALKPVFQRLSEDSLLSKFLDGKTQNQNECLNGMIWERVPKGTFVGSDVLQLGMYDAVANFNIGCRASIKTLDKLGISPGQYCQVECHQRDNLRVNKANYKEQDGIKKRRKLLRGRKKKKSDKAKEKEGVTYAAGSSSFV